MIRNGMRPIHSEEILRGEYLDLLKMSVNAHFQCVACTDYRLPTIDYRLPGTLRRYLCLKLEILQALEKPNGCPDCLVNGQPE
jgi:hypothetical protein